MSRGSGYDLRLDRDGASLSLSRSGATHTVRVAVGGGAREIVRRLGTSAAQLYRLLDQTNYRKSVAQLLALLQVLDCEVDLVVRTKTA